MGRVFVISDLHLCHNREFIWKERGYNSIEEHDRKLIENWNRVVSANDTVYVLGDVMFRSDGEKTLFDNGLEKLKQLNGNIIIIRGNHDSPDKIKLYERCHNVISADNAAIYIKYPEEKGYNFYLSHYPTLIYEKPKKMKTAVINLFGHTHQKDRFFVINGKENPYMYCCCMDAHNCTPILLDDIIEDILKKRSAYRDDIDAMTFKG